jgi:hypothetical protein
MAPSTVAGSDGESHRAAPKGSGRGIGSPVNGGEQATRQRILGNRYRSLNGITATQLFPAPHALEHR